MSMSDAFYTNCMGYIVHPARGNAPPIYRWMINRLQHGYKVVYAVEAVPHLTIERLSAINREVLQHVKNETLQVVDPELLYSKSLTASEAAVDEWLSIIGEADGSRRSPILIISTPELLGNDGRLETLQSVSEALDREWGGRVEVICCYSLDWFFGLDLGHAISLMSINERNLSRHELLYNAAAKSRIMDAISRGLDNILGKGSGRLILTTMGFLHNVDREDLLADPHSFEARLRRLIGNAADHAIPELVSTFRDELILSQQYLMGRPDLPAR
jgi:hypothetical protein